jgi:hypothetical protein
VASVVETMVLHSCLSGAVTVKQKLVAASPPFLALLAAWVWLPPIQRWFGAFVRIPEMRTPYTVAFFGLLAILVLSLRADWVLHTRRIVLIPCSLIAGQAVAFVGVVVAAGVQGGFDRLLRALQISGWGSLIVHFTLAFILGGWLLSAVLFVLYRLLLSSSFVQRLA